MSLIAWLLLFLALLVITVLSWLLKTNVSPDVRLFEEEKVYLDSNNKATPFPAPWSPETIYLSLIIPAYNEEKRLNPMMEETMKYCVSRSQRDPTFTYELIIVSDGSKDKTVQVAQEWVRKYPDNIRVMALVKNRGKGGAVKRGMMVSRGSSLLIVDADGATKFSDIEHLESSLKSKIKSGHGICVGSRAHLQQQAEKRRSFARNMLTWGFHFVVTWVGGVTGIQDTQCGFKLLSRASAKLIFPLLHLERWAFDVELLWLAQQCQIPIGETYVDWTEIAGSHLEEEDTRIVSVNMFLDLLRTRLSYTIGLWRRPSFSLSQLEKKQEQVKAAISASKDDHGRIQILQSDDQWDTSLTAAGDKVVVADFTAVWCGPCQKIAPRFQELSVSCQNMVFLKVDVDALPETSQKVGIEVMPTFLFLKEGNSLIR